jgi:uncharacterized protein YndB with AHSA1/START domain
MKEKEKTVITIQVTVLAPPEKAWAHFTSPDSICKWNQASEDWHTPWASNDLRPGGKFRSRMEAKDGSFGFDFEGIYDRVEPFSLLEYTMADERKVKIRFIPVTEGTFVEESFEAEDQNSTELQRDGWQAILNSYKAYTEAN